MALRRSSVSRFLRGCCQPVRLGLRLCSFGRSRPVRNSRRAWRPVWSSTAVLLVLCTLPTLSPAPAGAAPSGVTVATGSITCRSLTGSVTFTPPVRQRVRQMDTSVFSLHASDCTTKGSNVARVSGGSLSITNRDVVVGCSGLLNSKLITATERWQPSSVAPSNLFSEEWTQRGNGGAKGLLYSNGPLEQVMVFPAPGNAFWATGSFAGRVSYSVAENLHGSIIAYTNRTFTQLRDECNSVAGLSGFDIVSGVETVP